MNKMRAVVVVKTVFFTVRAEIGAKPLGRQRTDSIIVRNPLTNSDGTGNTQTVLVGDGGGQNYDLLPGQETPIIYASDLKDVYVRLCQIVGGDTAAPVDLVIIAHLDPIPVSNV